MNAKRVLFVDDDAALGKMFADFLSGSGYQARTTATGAEALRQLVEFQPHLVVLDIGLPDISGLEILRQLKANPLTRNVLVILITGASGLEMKIEGYQTGANDYLSKPINLRELRLKIERCFLNLKDQDTAVAFKHKEMLKSIVNTLGQGLYRGWDELRRVPAGSQSGLRVIVLFTDGAPNSWAGNFNVFPGYAARGVIRSSDFPAVGGGTTNTPNISALTRTLGTPGNPADTSLWSGSSPANSNIDLPWTTGTPRIIFPLPTQSFHPTPSSAGIPTRLSLEWKPKK